MAATHNLHSVALAAVDALFDRQFQRFYLNDLQ